MVNSIDKLVDEMDTNLLTVESHPFHRHGFNFFVVGTGIGITLILLRILLSTTWCIMLRGTLLVFPLVVGQQFGSELIIQCLVLSLSFGVTHKLGFESSICYRRLIRTGSICSPSTKGPSLMLANPIVKGASTGLNVIHIDYIEVV